MESTRSFIASNSSKLYLTVHFYKRALLESSCCVLEVWSHPSPERSLFEAICLGTWDSSVPVQPKGSGNSKRAGAGLGPRSSKFKTEVVHLDSKADPALRMHFQKEPAKNARLLRSIENLKIACVARLARSAPSVKLRLSWPGYEISTFCKQWGACQTEQQAQEESCCQF